MVSMFQLIGDMAGAFLVMTIGVEALEKSEVNALSVAKLVKIATAEIISCKVLFVFIQDNKFLSAMTA